MYSLLWYHFISFLLISSMLLRFFLFLPLVRFLLISAVYFFSWVACTDVYVGYCSQPPRRFLPCLMLLRLRTDFGTSSLNLKGIACRFSFNNYYLEHASRELDRVSARYYSALRAGF